MKTRRFGCFSVGLAAIFAGMSAAMGQDAVNVSFKLTAMALPLHAPVIVEFSLHNATGEPIRFDLGFNRKENFEFLLTGGGHLHELLPPLSASGFGRVGEIKLGPGETYAQKLVLNEWYRFSQPGKYEIDARMIGPIRTQASGLIQLSASPPKLHFEILPAEAVLLKQICRELAQVAVQEPSYEKASDAALALSFMDSPAVVPCLDEVLNKGRLVISLAVSGLERIGNREAATALILALPNEDPDLDSVVRSALRRVREKTEDATLKIAITTALRE